ncbi:hypothetical protein HK099_008471 [Clydaea vesicula]|uniref:Low temperature requirement A n=1 Tax=Clydaea vesicula TaxID=447962 RepID=A0AAD5XVU7_9FUNG|nr:hypothetical protein HK099_008471 [Clydaea vesicula]
MSEIAKEIKDEEIAMEVDIDQLDEGSHENMDLMGVGGCNNFAPSQQNIVEELVMSDSITQKNASTIGEVYHESVDEFGELTDTEIRYIDTSEMEKLDRELRHTWFTNIHVRQYFHGNILYRERHMRKVTWDELFIDLLYVALFNRAGHIIGHHPDMNGLTEYLLVIYPIINSWTLLTYQSNRYGVNFYFKVYSWFAVVLAAVMGVNCENIANSDPHENTSHPFIISFLIARFLYLLYGGLGANHQRKSYVLLSFMNFVASIPWIISLFVDAKYRNILWFTSMALDYFGSPLTILAYKVSSLKNFVNLEYSMALNIEHFVERNGLFVIVALGEVVIAFLFESRGAHVSKTFLATMMGILISFSLNWIYFNIDGTSFKIHAFRRGKFYGVIWNMMHTPLIGTIILFGANMAVIVEKYSNHQSLVVKNVGKASEATTNSESEVKNNGTITIKNEEYSDVIPVGARWCFVFGAALILLIFTIIQSCHISVIHSCNVARIKRTIIRVGISIGLGLFAAFGEKVPTLETMIIVAFTMIFLVSFEEWGRIQSKKRNGNGEDKKK